MNLKVQLGDVVLPPGHLLLQLSDSAQQLPLLQDNVAWWVQEATGPLSKGFYDTFTKQNKMNSLLQVHLLKKRSTKEMLHPNFASWQHVAFVDLQANKISLRDF